MRVLDLGPGPWDDEPDRVLWTDDATGLVCLARRGPLGAWCGYVGVPVGHPFHGENYHDVPADVHGGLTYAAPCDDDPEHGICHVPEPGQPEHLWWLGFDCGHSFDLVPRMESVLRELDVNVKLPYSPPRTYRDLAYVQEQCRELAIQLAAADEAAR